MQSLSREILSNIFNYLPWNDAIRLESLCSQFRDLPYEKSQLNDLSIRTHNELSFEMDLEMLRNLDANVQPKLFFIIRDTVGRRKYFLTIHYYESVELDLQETRMDKHQRYATLKSVEMPPKKADLAARIYQKLMRRLTFKTVEFRYLPREFYRRISPKKTNIFSQTVVEFSTSNRRLNEAEISFLDKLNGVRLFQLVADNEFEECENLWNLLCVQSSKQLHLEFKRENYDRSYYGRGQTDGYLGLELNDTRLQELIDRKVLHMQTNAVCPVTFDFLFKYVQDCLAGRTHIMHYLGISLKDTVLRRMNLEDRFKAEFELMQIPMESPGLWEKEVGNRPRKDGYDPDKIIIRVFSSRFIMIADFAEFKGRGRFLRGSMFYTEDQ